MAEYIEREKLQEALQRKKSGPATIRYTEGWNDCLMRVKSMVHSAPAADVRPVRRGYWVDVGGLSCRCSECGCKNDRETRWCPNCGAYMGGAKE